MEGFDVASGKRKITPTSYPMQVLLSGVSFMSLEGVKRYITSSDSEELLSSSVADYDTFQV